MILKIVLALVLGFGVMATADLQDDPMPGCDPCPTAQ